jgi:hypothetical protein
MANKTQPTNKSIHELLESIDDTCKKEDTLKLIGVFEEVIGVPPVIWGDNIIGFDAYSYKYASGRSGTWLLSGFACRKKYFTLYLSCDVNQLKFNLAKLGKVRKGVGCLYIKKVNDINLLLLKKLIKKAAEMTRNKYATSE